MARKAGEKKADWVAREVAEAVNAGKAWDLETVDFSDPNRPPTCLEIDFPILPINQISAIEGNAGKPIYQMSKWWARRRSSVFRSMLLAAATKAPDDPADAAKVVWDAYYGNHQKKGSFDHLKVADIFMGGGTTIVEGSRLGMQMYGNDLNPVAWFVVNNEMADVSKTGVEALLAEVECDLKPQIMPFYSCDCPRGHKGKWKASASGETMTGSFCPSKLPPDKRNAYEYEGPEIIYTFWAKHGQCQATGCGHRTPIMSSAVMAIKSLSVRYWRHTCPACNLIYDLEEKDARMAPAVPLIVADTETPFNVLNGVSGSCPHCGIVEEVIPDVVNKKPKKKRIELSLLVHPNWLQGESGVDSHGRTYGGTADDEVDATVQWNQVRASECRLLEVRGQLPELIRCPDTGLEIRTDKRGGTVPKKSHFECGKCGKMQGVLESTKATKTNCPVAQYASQGYCFECDRDGELYGGRFFIAMDDSSTLDLAIREWDSRKANDLSNFWPKSEIPYGFMTALNNGDIREGHGFTHWWKMFNPRQLLVQAHLLKTISSTGDHSAMTRRYVLGSFQLHLRNQCMFSFWHIKLDKLAPALSNSNFHPKSTFVEVGVFCPMGYGPWRSTYKPLFKSIDWAQNPWELVYNQRLAVVAPALAEHTKGKSEKVRCNDRLPPVSTLSCSSSTDLSSVDNSSYDLVVTDPPFGGLLHYSELSDFFYVWLRLVLKDDYPDIFGGEYTPKTLEAVANRARQPGQDKETSRDNADIFYQRLLTAAWGEAHRILKPGGILAFTFHHSEDAPWVAVLESLFEAGYYLAATYPSRSDETKGQGSKPGTFGSQKIEYDIIHVCRKRLQEPEAISWAKLRRQVLQDVRQLKEILEHHQKSGLPEADLQVIRRGKALEYFSRHYGQVFKDEGVPITVLEALVGINQLLDEENSDIKESPPHHAEPFTRMFLKLFDGKAQLERDQIQKFLRGTGSSPSDFVDRGWCYEKSKIFYLKDPIEIAQDWQGRHRKGMSRDYDQTAYLVGACFEGSGINASETLNNSNFKPHPALAALLTWHISHGATSQIRSAAIIASKLFNAWSSKQRVPTGQQLSLNFNPEDE